MEYDYLPGRPVTLGAMYDERSVTSFQALTFISSNEKKKERERERENVQYRDASLNIFLADGGSMMVYGLELTLRILFPSVPLYVWVFFGGGISPDLTIPSVTPDLAAPTEILTAQHYFEAPWNYRKMFFFC